METNLFASMKGNLTIPATSVKIAGFDGQDLDAHIGEGAIVLFREEMDAQELIDTIEFLKDLSTELTVALACACGQCDECGYCYSANCVQFQAGGDCDCCETPCNGVEIPACLLKEAGIDAEVSLQFDTRNGEIIIREIDEEWGGDELDITEYVPEGLLEVLRNSGVCLNTLREMLQDERIIYG